MIILNEPKVGLVHSNYRVIHCVLSTELGNLGYGISDSFGAHYHLMEKKKRM